MNYQIIKSVLGMRGSNPNTIDTTELLIDRLDERGIHIKTWQSGGEEKNAWQEAGLGSLPSEAELALAETPLIALAVLPNGTGDGLVFTATLTDAPDGTATQWRLIDPLGAETLTNGTTTGAIDTWEIETNEPGVYLVQVWAAGYGWVELSAEGI